MWLYGVAFITMSLVIMSVIGMTQPHTATLTCQRFSVSRVNCQLQRLYIFGKNETLIITNPQKARISRISRQGQQVILDNLPLLPRTGYDAKHQYLADQINKFIASQQADISVKQHNLHLLFIIYTFLSAFIGIGLLLLSSPVITCTFSKKSNNVLINYRSLSKNKNFEYKLVNVLGVELQIDSSKELYRPAIILKWESKPIFNHYENLKNIHNTIETINNFLTDK
jgi:hypothetical protein